jgi:hypothetical protein
MRMVLLATAAAALMLGGLAPSPRAEDAAKEPQQFTLTLNVDEIAYMARELRSKPLRYDDLDPLLRKIQSQIDAQVGQRHKPQVPKAPEEPEK